jgi:hypothetical protein
VPGELLLALRAMTPRTFAAIGLLLTSNGCASFEDDGFRSRLHQGCHNETDCMFLVEQATERDRQCRQSAFRRCDETGADLGAASRMARVQATHDMQKRSEEYQREQVERERSEAAQREEDEAAYEAEQLARNEQQRDAEDSKKRRLERIKIAARDPQYLVPILSMRICDAIKELQSLKSDLDDEREIERRSGVRDLAERRDIAESQIDAEGRLQDLRARLRALNAKPLPCGAEYKHLTQCRQTEGQASCEDVRTLIEILQSDIDVESETP